MLRINRYIVGCKFTGIKIPAIITKELIDT